MNLHRLAECFAVAAIVAAAGIARAQVTAGDVYAEWDFPNSGPSSAFDGGGNLPATITSSPGSQLSLSSGAGSVYSIINSTMYGNSQNMIYGAGTSDPATYLSMTIPGLPATPSDSRVNAYTMVWNMWLPHGDATGNGNYIGLYDAQYPNLGNNNHANMYVNTDGSIGSNGSYVLPTPFDSWHQYAVTVAPDAGNPGQLLVTGYVDGVLGGTISVSNNSIDQDNSLYPAASGNPAALIFADNFSGVNYTDDLYLSSFAFVGRALSSSEVHGLVADLSTIPNSSGNGTGGFGPNPAGILTVVPEPGTLALALTGAAALSAACWRRRRTRS